MPIERDISLLNPEFARRCKRLHEYLIDAHETGRTKTRFEIFETFRHPARQRHLLKIGSTKAAPFQSAHQFGLACDFVPHLSPEEAVALGEKIGERVLPGWNWHSTHDYSFLAASAQRFQVAIPITWDPCHVQHPRFYEFRENYRKLFE